MKKLFFISLLSIPFFCNAQFLPEFGIKTGFSGSKLLIDTTGQQQETETVGGFYVTGFCELYRTNGFNLMASAGFIEKGGLSIFDITNSQGTKIGETKTYYNFQYITLAGYGKLKGKLKEVPNLYPYILLGLRLDLLQSEPSTLDYNFSNTNFGGLAGFGVDYDFEKVSAFLEFQRNLNLTSNLTNNSGVTVIDKTFVICLGLKFLFLHPKTNDSPPDKN
jgi:hypothetical protein